MQDAKEVWPKSKALRMEQQGKPCALVFYYPANFMILDCCPNLHRTTTDFTISNETLLSLSIIQYNLNGLTAKRASNGS
ncbi:uncharacterized protein METZ01_LOCUS417704 [marine metagenome]|uniref:Uncharacterized protein n=1 Tax=marine metagenome TaxID=408172 RepID=A0A382X1W8_9ZZZZ